jgi:hypothetical protein
MNLLVVVKKDPSFCWIESLGSHYFPVMLLVLLVGTIEDGRPAARCLTWMDRVVACAVLASSTFPTRSPMGFGERENVLP